MGFFEKRRQKKQQVDDAFAKVYEEIAQIENWDDPKKLEHYILDSCEQIIALTKEIEGERAEYRIVTAYLTDIQSLEKLPEEQLSEIKEAASHIAELTKARNNYLKFSPNLTEEQFLMIEQEQEEVPAIIHRMMEHERYQDKTKREKAVLEAQKSEWEIEKEEVADSRKLMKRVSVSLLAFYGTLLVLLLVIQKISNFDLTIAYLMLFFVGAFGTFGLYIRDNWLKKRMRLCIKKYNQSVQLLNVVRMKYVNVTKSVDYTKDKYGVRSSAELNYIWEQYTEAVREKEKFIRNNDDLEFFNGRMMRLLSKINLHDRKIWLDQAKALIDEDEMRAIKQKLIDRRHKIQAHIDESRNIVQSERNEIDSLMAEHEHYVPEIIEIIKSVDKLCSL